MHFSEFVKADAKIYQKAKRFLPILKRKPSQKKRKSSRISKPTKRRKQNSCHKLSNINAETANAILKLHDLETANFTSVFILMVLDLKIMFPKLDCFVEENDWFSWVGRPPLETLSYGCLLDCPVFCDRIVQIEKANMAYGGRDTTGNLCLASLGNCKAV